MIPIQPVEKAATSNSWRSRHDWDIHWRDYNAAVEKSPAQRYRRQVITNLLERNGCGDGARILDIGSGQGDLAADLRQAFPHAEIDRKSTRLNSSHMSISYAVFCL